MEKRFGKGVSKYGNYAKYLNDRISQILSFSKDILEKINLNLGTNFYLDGRTWTVKEEEY